MKKIILIDGNSLMFRAYYATAYSGNLMRNKDGLYTNAIFAFSNIMTKLQNEEKTHFFVAFDAGAKTFRHQQYSAYKGGRKALPEELLMQIPYIKRFLDVIKIKHYEMNEYEADDLIATVATLAEEENFDEIKIISGDKDLLQLVRGNVKVYLTKKGASELDEYNEDNFFTKMNIYPNQVTDYKGLVGDSSDNLPGIKGIGEVSALKLLNQFKSLEAIIANTSLIKGKQQMLISEGYKEGLESKRLATLEAKIPLSFKIEDFLLSEYDPHTLIAFYQEMGFDSLINRIEVKNEYSEKTQEKNEDLIMATMNYDFSKITEASIIIESQGKDFSSLEIIGIAIISDNLKIFVEGDIITNSLSFKEYLQGQNKKIIFDYKKAIVLLNKYHLEMNNVIFDTLLAAYIINPSKASDNYKQVLDEFVTNDLSFDKEVYQTKAKEQLNIALIANQAIAKAKWNNHLKVVLEKNLRNNKQEELFSLEMNLSKVLADIEKNGLLIDRKMLKEVEADLLVKQEEITNEIYTLAQEEFNINSPKQLNTILFEKMGLPSGKKNKTGYSTAADVLEKLAPKYPIVAKILDYRAITKIITTYVNGMYEVMNKQDFIHPLYKQALTVTGRLSSVSPNIQNMPIRSELGQVIRKAFISRYPNGRIMSCDYSQIELRILAHLSNDQTMKKMFTEDVDFHSQTAAQMYEIPISEVSKEMRQTAKAINFGIVYGISAWGLAQNVKISSEQAERFIAKYFSTFPMVRKYLDETVTIAKQNGYTTTILNRIRYIPELASDNKALAAFGQRTAMNSPIQGSAADLIKLAMLTVHKALANKKSKMIAQVHDELVFDVYPGEEESLKAIVKEKMETALKLSVPLKVEVGIGINWLEA